MRVFSPGRSLSLLRPERKLGRASRGGALFVRVPSHPRPGACTRERCGIAAVQRRSLPPPRRPAQREPPPAHLRRTPPHGEPGARAQGAARRRPPCVVVSLQLPPTGHPRVPVG